ncbi:MAG: metal ABC transporter ATP-binding protein [Gemmataceae bacterium]
MKPLVSIDDVHVTLGGVEILHGIQAELGRGQITALLGLNGSGKTTLLRAILKEVSYAGQIRFHCGHDHSHPTPEHVGYVPQKLQIDARMPLTVRDLMALALQTRPLFFGVTRAARQTMTALLEKVGAGHLLDSPVENISGGELQRVLLALALHPEPELLLLDEPAAGIDFKDQQRFYELIADLNRNMGVTILLVSHDTHMVTKHAHLVLCLKDGAIKCQGPPSVLTGETLAQVFGAEMGVYAHHHH